MPTAANENPLARRRYPERGAEAAKDRAATRAHHAVRANVAGQYRTMCVRLCDGFCFPVTEATRPTSFAADEERCRSSCTTPAKLFYMTNSEDDAARMTALGGTRYADLPSTFRYRSEYVMQCDCKPKPWSEEAKLVFDRRTVLAQRTMLERKVAAGSDGAGRLLAQGELKIAEVKS